jgi:hypothetical protein
MTYYDRKDMTAYLISQTPCTFCLDISDNKKVYTMRFFLNGRLHRTNGPANISFEPERPDKLYLGSFSLNGLHCTRYEFEACSKIPLEEIPLQIHHNFFYSQILEARLKGERTSIVSQCSQELKDIMNQMIEIHSLF